MVYGGKTPMLPREDFAALGFAGAVCQRGAAGRDDGDEAHPGACKQAGSLAGAESDILRRVAMQRGPFRSLGCSGLAPEGLAPHRFNR